MRIEEELARRVGHPVNAVVPSPHSTAYRARIDLSVGPDGRLGTWVPRSHEHIPLQDEPLARPEIQALLPELRELNLKGLGRVELRSDGTRVIAHARMPKKKRPQRDLALRLPFEDIALEGKTLRGDPKLHLEVQGIAHQISPGSFYQINLEVNALLVARVTEILARLKPAHLLDLYAGIGNLSLPTVASGVPATLVESMGSSAKDARATLKRLDLNATILEQDAGKLEAGQVFADVVLLDPPRAGAPGVIPTLSVTRPRAFVYVSCNAATLGRDLNQGVKAGYKVTELVGLEMFPGTEHFEALAVLERA